jgi:hypothetical protein
MEIGVYVTVANINLGAFYGSLISTVTVNIKLDGSEGYVLFYLKNGNEVWTIVNVSGHFHSHLKKEIKIMTF